MSLALCGLISPCVTYGQADLGFLESSPGDYIGGGATYFSTNRLDIAVTTSDESLLTLNFLGWVINLAAPLWETLKVGVYPNAIRYPFNGEQSGLSIWGNGRGCNTVCGEFEIHELDRGPDGTVEHLWVTFTQHCECFMAPLKGDIRISSRTAPAGPEPRTLRVPRDYPTIQSAIDAAGVYGDTVVVLPGIYRETVFFRGKRVLVTSEQGPEVTRIQPPTGAVAVVINSGETRESELRGFTLENGAGGIEIGGSEPTVTGNVIINNGYGINCGFASPLIRSNRIANSTIRNGPFQGAGIYIGGAAAAVVEANLIEGNAHGLILWSAGTPTIRNNIIRQNAGDGIGMVNSSVPDIVQNVIARNAGFGIQWGGGGPNRIAFNTIVENGPNGGAGIFAFPMNRVTIENNLIVGRVPFLCGGQPDGTGVFRFNNAYSPEGSHYEGGCANLVGFESNISEPPKFLDAASGDYRLQRGSSSIDAAHDGSPWEFDIVGNPRAADGDGNLEARPDLGALEYVPGPPRAVTRFQVNLTPTIVNLQWEPFDDADEYVVGRSTTRGGPYEILASVATPNFADRSWVADIIYYYVVAGRNQFGTGTYSTEAVVRPGNRPPKAQDDFVTVDEDNEVTIAPLLNDSDPNGDTLSIHLVSLPLDGTVSDNGNEFRFIPAPNFFGTTSFTYSVDDGRGGTSLGTVVVVVRPVNDPPEAVPYWFTAQANQSETWTVKGLDVDSVVLNYSLKVPPQHGIAWIDPATGEFSYRPAWGFIGQDQVSYAVSDQDSVGSSVPITIQVQGWQDVDGDGMGDGWENLWDLNNPLADPDGDGISNRDEYLANTSPRDANSKLRVLTIEFAEDGRCFLSWASVGGTRYRILSADSANTAPLDFREVLRPALEEMDPGTAGQPSVQTFIDTRPPPTSGIRFYRVQVVQ
ncbi:MAG TPA: hypothetical protein DCE44_19780 [Verrucomicrobiales bacterium]|nr:hypothetical protein [Verrucomicrobiales bacterium]